MFCRFCGKTVFDDSVFCSYCGKQLIARIDNESTNFDFSSLDGALNADKEYQAKLNKARAFAITNKYQQAMEIYTKMIDDDPTDLNGYIGCIRVASKNFTDIGGYFYFRAPDNTTSSYFTSASIETFKKLLNGASISDKECEEFIKKYDEHLKQQEKAKLEQEKARLEQERKRQEEIERQKREKEEAEKRKPFEYKEALKLGDKAILENKNEEAYKFYSTAIKLARELQRTVPSTIIQNLYQSCLGREREARKNNSLVKYVTSLAENNDATAQVLLARIYHYGSYEYISGIGDVYREIYTAEIWYRKAANNGSAEAMCYFGDCVYRKARESSSGDAQREMYLQAYYWYKKAFEKNHPRSIEMIAFYHRCGLYVDKNTNLAIELYKKINRNTVVAEIYLRDLKNPLEAISWYKKSNSYLEIASIYESLGRKNDAIEYYRKCVESSTNYNNDQAEKALARLMYGK